MRRKWNKYAREVGRNVVMGGIKREARKLISNKDA